MRQGGGGDVRARLQGCGFVPDRSLTCHTARYNRNACVPLTLERQSVNVLTCEFPHRIRPSERPRRVQWGEKEGGDEEPDRPGRPSQREQHNQLENNPPTRTWPTEPATTEQAPTNTRPNLSDQREQQPRPQVENNPTRTQPARQTTRQPNPPPQKRTATHKTPTNRQQPPPKRGTARTKNHSTPSGWGRELRRGLRGTAPHTSHHPTNQEPGPARQTPPPSRHPHLTTQPQPETSHQNQDPHRPPTTPPPTPHQVPCTHAMDHIQPTSTLANKLEQNQETSPHKSKLQMRRPRPSHHPTTYQ